jgi:hypothetical protein
MTTKNCSLCGAVFLCGGHHQQPCWCSHYPAIMPITDGQDCRCPACLTVGVQEKINDYLQKNPMPTVVPEQYRHAKLIEHIDYYIENGNWVFTAWFHCKRGECCGSGCRHCPYDHENVR